MDEDVSRFARGTKFTLALSVVGAVVGSAYGYAVLSSPWVILSGWLGFLFGGAVGAVVDFPKYAVVGAIIGTAFGAALLALGVGEDDGLVRLPIYGIVIGATCGAFRLAWQQSSD